MVWNFVISRAGRSRDIKTHSQFVEPSATKELNKLSKIIYRSVGKSHELGS